MSCSEAVGTAVKVTLAPLLGGLVDPPVGFTEFELMVTTELVGRNDGDATLAEEVATPIVGTDELAEVAGGVDGTVGFVVTTGFNDTVAPEVNNGVTIWVWDGVVEGPDDALADVVGAGDGVVSEPWTVM